MPDYPIDPHKLLDAARALAPPDKGRGRPPYTHHRRAISTAYYAVFHAITDRVATAVFPHADEAFRRRSRRWINHGDIRTVSSWVEKIDNAKGAGLPPHIRTLLAPDPSNPHIDQDVVTISSSFLELNERREEADYDHDVSFPRGDTLGYLELAEDTVSRVQSVTSDASHRFFGLIAMQAKISSR